MPTVNAAIESWSTESEASTREGFLTLDYNPVRVFSITCSPDATHEDLYEASGLPAAGSAHPRSNYVFAEKARMRRLSPILAEATIRYQGTKRTDDQNNPDPLALPAEIEWSDVETEEEIDCDFDGNQILTACGEKVSGIKAVFCDQVVTIRKNMSAYNSYVAAAYRRSVNADNFLGWPPGTAKMMKLSAKSVNASYWVVTAVVQFRIPYQTTAAKAWYARWLHQGFYHKIDETIGGVTKTLVVRAVDDDKKPTTAQVLLDTNGYRLASGATPIWRETKRYGSLTFGALGLV